MGAKNSLSVMLLTPRMQNLLKKVIHKKFPIINTTDYRNIFIVGPTSVIAFSERLVLWRI